MQNEQTLYEYICEMSYKSGMLRLERMKVLKVPEILIENQEHNNNVSKNKKVSITGDKEALNEMFLSMEEKIGNGGKKYIMFNTKSGKIVNYFPQAKFGKYIKYASKIK